MIPATITWQFKRHFRTGALGWKGSALACKWIGEAVSEIKKVAKIDLVDAADGVVAFCERLWPALQHVDSSSGALGSAANRALDVLLPILISAPATAKIRAKWLERLDDAICEDGVDFLYQVRQEWGKVCSEPTFMNAWADRLLPMVRQMWAETESFSYSPQTVMCLSCLLEAGRYDELQALLATAPHRSWHEQSYWAEALRRRDEIEAAITFAEGCRTPQGYDDAAISAYCEQLLLDAGRWEDAYTRYGRSRREGHTYINQYRALVKKYPMLDTRRILQDLIEDSANPGDWFAAARTAGYLDIALSCAQNGHVNPGTLATAANDTVVSEPDFSFAIALRALHLFLDGYGFEHRRVEMLKAADALVGAAQALGNPPLCLEQVQSLVARVMGSRDSFAELLRSHLGRNWPGLQWDR
ncbi:MAG TPA: hypothetical protein VHV83_02315 [Armatimonadota bacterium]|nr:hypothetical protein [Armatimonadota bacterium]